MNPGERKERRGVGPACALGFASSCSDCICMFDRPDSRWSGRPLPAAVFQSLPKLSRIGPLVAIQDRYQELQVVFDRSIRHALAARPDPARPSRPDEAVPVPSGKGGRVAVPSEEPEEHEHGSPVVPPLMRGRFRPHSSMIDLVRPARRLGAESPSTVLTSPRNPRRRRRWGACRSAPACRSSRSPAGT